MDTVNIIWSGPNALGEGPLWHPTEKVLYWIDIAEHLLYQLNPTTNKIKSWIMPAPIGCIVVRKKGGFIAAIGEEICFIEMPSGKVSPQKKISGGLRLNDGKCDRQGRFWFGSVCVEQPKAVLYRYDPDGKLKKMEEGIYISNGLDWSLDNKSFYYTDSGVRKIFHYDFGAETGSISNRRTFIETQENDGVPDGLTIDSEGYIWSAHFNGGKICRYSTDGLLDCEIKMPVQRPTCCIFGGPDMNQLFITSCSRDINETEVLPSPAGSLFRADLKVSGLPATMFEG